MKEEPQANQEESHAQLFSAEEYLPILKLVETFVEKGASETPPKFVVFTGGIASGKTTIRRQRYANGYVNFDFGDVLAAAKKLFGEENPKLTTFAVIACGMILRQSLDARKNIVIEIIGDNKALFDPVFKKMGDIGYKCEICFINCDPVEGYKRHLKAVAEDKDYLSSYFYQDATLEYFYKQLGLEKTTSASPAPPVSMAPPPSPVAPAANESTFSRAWKWLSRKRKA